MADEAFKTSFGKNIYYQKYANTPETTWSEKAWIIANEVCGGLVSDKTVRSITKIIEEMKFLPGGRYLYYAGRDRNFYNNCFCLTGEEDTREEWSRLVSNVMSCLMVGGGIGVDYSVFREEGAILKGTGGIASGPIPLMMIMNEVGRNVMQGGSRRSAGYASLSWSHPDIFKFLRAKDWSPEVRELKAKDFNFPAPLDMTNISVNYDDHFLEAIMDVFHEDHERAMSVWKLNVKQMLKTGEPGMSFNFGEQSKETLRNACAEFISDTDSDVCNLGSVNLARIDSLVELEHVCYLASQFLVCGGYRAELPYEKVHETRAKNRSIGMGIMGVHEWLLKKGYGYEVVPELRDWYTTWNIATRYGANYISDKLKINRPRKYHAIAPTGTIGILAGTTTGIEPLFAVSYKRRYLIDGKNWRYEYVIDPIAKRLIEEDGVDPEAIETAYELSNDPEKRLKFQYETQKFVDMGISSTVNLPAYGNHTITPDSFAKLLLKYAPGLRGITVYPDGARGGQPLTMVPYHEAVELEGQVFDEELVLSTFTEDDIVEATPEPPEMIGQACKIGG